MLLALLGNNLSSLLECLLLRPKTDNLHCNAWKSAALQTAQGMWNVVIS